MKDDIVPELLEEIEKDFNKQLKKSQIAKRLQEKVLNGTATYQDANEYAIEVGEILANAYQSHLSSSVLPDGRMYFNIAKNIIEPTMKSNYNLIASMSTQVQQVLNKDAQIGIKPITPKLNSDRIDGIVNRISDEENFDKIAWILDEPIKNFSQSIVDDSIRENAEFQYKAGMMPKIIRNVSGDCCDWCQEVAGTYTYPDVPKDVYRRHQRCRCTVDYYPRNGKVQNVHTKKWRNEDVYDRILLSEELAKKDTIRKLLKLNSKVTVSIPPRKIDADTLSFDSNHINTERGREITREDAVRWINNSLFSVTVWDGAFERYYGPEGAVYVDLSQNAIRTAFERKRYTQNLVDSLEVL